LAEKYSTTLVLENKSGPLLSQLNDKITVKEYRLSSCRFTLLRKILNFSHRLCWTILNYNKYIFSCNYATYSVIGSKLACVASKNSALYVHSNYLGYFQGDKLKTCSFFENVNIDKFKNVIFVSNECKEAAEEIFPDKSNNFFVINNIINSEEIEKKSNAAVEQAFDGDKTNILFVGRLDDTSKNFVLLLESFRLAYQKNENLRLYIIGNGPDEAKIKEYIKNHSICGITLLGEKQNPYPYIKMCDCMILTSKYEGYPVVYTEALILNKQFITTVPVSDDYINVRDFFTITDFKPQNIASAILKVNKNKINYNLDFNFANQDRIRKIERIIFKRGNNNEN